MKYKQNKSLDPLQANSFRDLLPVNSDVFEYEKLMSSLDFSKFDNRYKGEGQVPIDPKLMIQTILYGFTHKVTSMRSIETACRNDIRYIVLSGNLRPDRRTFDRFLIRHADAIKELFVQVVDACKSKDLIGLKRIAIDGSRFKGQTKPYGIKYEKMNAMVDKLNFLIEVLKGSELTEMNQEIENLKNRIEKLKEAKKKSKLSLNLNPLEVLPDQLLQNSAL